MDRLDSRSFGEGSILYSADRHGHHDVSDDENDAANHYGPGATENDVADAVDVWLFLFQPVQWIEFVHVHEQSGRHRPAGLFKS